MSASPAAAGTDTTTRAPRLVGAVLVVALGAGCASRTVSPPAAPSLPAAASPVQVMVPPRRADFAGAQASPPARRLAHWVVGSADHQGLGFMIVDKKDARVFVFDAVGRLRGTSPVLLGAARGDDSVPGIGNRPMTQVKPKERTTPAGRFLAEPGLNTRGEDIVWVDYDAAVSMHRLRMVSPAERRAQRLASPQPDDNRISYGCINVPPGFYDNVVRPLFSAGYGMVYVLPEIKPMRQVFDFRPSASKGRRQVAKRR